MESLNLLDVSSKNTKDNNVLGKKHLVSNKDSDKLNDTNKVKPEKDSDEDGFPEKLKKLSEKSRTEKDDGKKLPSDEDKLPSKDDKLSSKDDKLSSKDDKLLEEDNSAAKNEALDEEKQEKSLAAFLSQLNIGIQSSGTQSQGMSSVAGGNISSINYSETFKNQMMTNFSGQNGNQANQQGGGFDFQKQFFDQDKLMASMNENKKIDADSSTFKLANIENRVAATETSTKSLSIKTPVTHKNWNGDFNNHIALMARNGGGNAKIKLNPAHLGPVEASIKIINEVATVNITANQAQTRDALDLGVARLKEMLEEQGFSQVDVNVSQEELAHKSQEPDKKGSGTKNASLDGEEKGDVSDSDESQITEASEINGVVDVHV